MALATESMASLTTETGELLRSRLQAAALFMAIGHAVFLVFGLLDHSSVVAAGVLTIGARVLLVRHGRRPAGQQDRSQLSSAPHAGIHLLRAHGRC